MGPSDLNRPPVAYSLPPTNPARYARDEFGDDAPAWLLELAARRDEECADAARPRLRDSLAQVARRAASFFF